MMNLKKKKFSVIIIGFGSIGRRHAKNLINLGFKDISVFRTYKSKTFYPPINGIKIYNNFNLAINQKKYDLMIIANPTSEHLKYALIGAKKKINLYIEKPLSNSLKNTKKLLQLEKKNKIKILIGCQLRFNENLLLIKDFLQKKKLGKIYSVFCDVGEYLPEWHPNENYKISYASRKKLGGGVILTLIHEIDYLYWIFGKFDSVYATGGKFTKLKLNVEDTMVGNIVTRNKVPISLRMDYWRRPPTRTLNIVGEKGQIFWDYYKRELKILYNSGKEIVNRLPTKWDRNDMFIKILKSFIFSIMYKKKSIISLADGMYGLKIALLLKKSLSKSTKIKV